jgi:hypothetical protein
MHCFFTLQTRFQTPPNCSITSDCLVRGVPISLVRFGFADFRPFLTNHYLLITNY